ncbi:MAG: pilin [Candidatus Campbellbacteria bacterium]|nr:pilin [Candidatus Campbellbacteria bacterium]
MNYVFAQTDETKKISPDCEGSGCGYEDLIMLVNNILDFLIILGFVAAGGVLFYATINYIFFGNQPTKREEARKMVATAFVGLVLLLSAWLIFEIIFSTLANSSITDQIFN